MLVVSFEDCLWQYVTPRGELHHAYSEEYLNNDLLPDHGKPYTMGGRWERDVVVKCEPPSQHNALGRGVDHYAHAPVSHHYQAGKQ